MITHLELNYVKCFKIKEKLNSKIKFKTYKTMFEKIKVLYLNLAERSILVSETQFPSMIPFPTVGIMLLRHATYNEHANQCITSPWQAKKQVAK